MKRELVICIIIIFIIIVGNVWSEKVTTESIETMTKELSNLREKLLIEDNGMDKEYAISKIKELEKKWHKIYDKLAYFIEHDELEKAENNMIALKSCIQVEEYSDCVKEIDETIFSLQHIKKKNMITLQNIF